MLYKHSDQSVRKIHSPPQRGLTRGWSGHLGISVTVIANDRRERAISAVPLHIHTQPLEILDVLRNHYRTEFRRHTGDDRIRNQRIDLVLSHLISTIQSRLDLRDFPRDFSCDRNDADPLELRADLDGIERLDELPTDRDLFQIDRRGDILCCFRLGFEIRRD